MSRFQRNLREKWDDMDNPAWIDPNSRGGVFVLILVILFYFFAREEKAKDHN